MDAPSSLKLSRRQFLGLSSGGILGFTLDRAVAAPGDVDARQSLKGLRYNDPLQPLVFRVTRAWDLLDLDLELVNFMPVREIGYPGDTKEIRDSADGGARRAASDGFLDEFSFHIASYAKPGYVILRLGGQHLAEQALWDRPVLPGDPQAADAALRKQATFILSVPPPGEPGDARDSDLQFLRAGRFKETDGKFRYDKRIPGMPGGIAGAWLAGHSQIVFEIPQRHAPLPFDFEGIMRIALQHGMLRVHPRLRETWPIKDFMGTGDDAALRMDSAFLGRHDTGAPFTRLEFPSMLYISPYENARWSLRPTSWGQRAELWSLDLQRPDRSQDHAGRPRELCRQGHLFAFDTEALPGRWPENKNPEGEPNRKYAAHETPKTSLYEATRKLLVKQMCEDNGDILAEDFRLTALGATAHLEYRPVIMPRLREPTVEIDTGKEKGREGNVATTDNHGFLTEWIQKTEIGRDYYVKEAFAGWWFPFQLAAESVTITERLFCTGIDPAKEKKKDEDLVAAKKIPANRDVVADAEGSLLAMLVARKFGIVKERQREFGSTESDDFDEVGSALARAMGLRKIEILVDRTPTLSNQPKKVDVGDHKDAMGNGEDLSFAAGGTGLEAGKEIFWPRIAVPQVAPGVGSRQLIPYRFPVRMTFIDGRVVETHMPMLFCYDLKLGAELYAEAPEHLCSLPINAQVPLAPPQPSAAFNSQDLSVEDGRHLLRLVSGGGLVHETLQAMLGESTAAEINPKKVKVGEIDKELAARDNLRTSQLSRTLTSVLGGAREGIFEHAASFRDPATTWLNDAASAAGTFHTATQGFDAWILRVLQSDTIQPGTPRRRREIDRWFFNCESKEHSAGMATRVVRMIAWGNDAHLGVDAARGAKRLAAAVDWIKGRADEKCREAAAAVWVTHFVSLDGKGPAGVDPGKLKKVVESAQTLTTGPSQESTKLGRIEENLAFIQIAWATQLGDVWRRHEWDDWFAKLFHLIHGALWPADVAGTKPRPPWQNAMLSLIQKRHASLLMQGSRPVDMQYCPWIQEGTEKDEHFLSRLFSPMASVRSAGGEKAFAMPAELATLVQGAMDHLVRSLNAATETGILEGQQALRRVWSAIEGALPGEMLLRQRIQHLSEDLTTLGSRGQSAVEGFRRELKGVIDDCGVQLAHLSVHADVGVAPLRQFLSTAARNAEHTLEAMGKIEASVRTCVEKRRKGLGLPPAKLPLQNLLAAGTGIGQLEALAERVRNKESKVREAAVKAGKTTAEVEAAVRAATAATSKASAEILGVDEKEALGVLEKNFGTFQFQNVVKVLGKTGQIPLKEAIRELSAKAEKPDAVTHFRKLLDIPAGGADTLATDAVAYFKQTAEEIEEKYHAIVKAVGVASPKVGQEAEYFKYLLQSDPAQTLAHFKNVLRETGGRIAVEVEDKLLPITEIAAGAVAQIGQIYKRAEAFGKAADANLEKGMAAMRADLARAREARMRVLSEVRGIVDPFRPMLRNLLTKEFNPAAVFKDSKVIRQEDTPKGLDAVWLKSLEERWTAVAGSAAVSVSEPLAARVVELLSLAWPERSVPTALRQEILKAEAAIEMDLAARWSAGRRQVEQGLNLLVRQKALLDAGLRRQVEELEKAFKVELETGIWQKQDAVELLVIWAAAQGRANFGRVLRSLLQASGAGGLEGELGAAEKKLEEKWNLIRPRLEVIQKKIGQGVGEFGQRLEEKIDASGVREDLTEVWDEFHKMKKDIGDELAKRRNYLEGAGLQLARKAELALHAPSVLKNFRDQAAKTVFHVDQMVLGMNKGGKEAMDVLGEKVDDLRKAVGFPNIRELKLQVPDLEGQQFVRFTDNYVKEGVRTLRDMAAREASGTFAEFTKTAQSMARNSGIADAVSRVDKLSRDFGSMTRQVEDQVNQITHQAEDFRKRVEGELQSLKDQGESQIAELRQRAEDLKKEVTGKVEAVAADLVQKAEDFIPAGAGKLFDVLPMKDILALVGSPDRAPQMLANRLPDRVERVYKWQTELKPFDLPGGLLGFMPEVSQGGNPPQIRISSSATVWVPKPGQSLRQPDLAINGQIDAFSLTLAGMMKLYFRGVTFSGRNGGFDFNPKLGRANVPGSSGGGGGGASESFMSFMGPLEAVDKIRERLAGLISGKNGPVVSVEDNRIYAGYSFEVPAITCGAMTIEHIRLSAALSLPLKAGALTFRFQLSERMVPFRVAVMAFTGGGYLGVQVSPDRRLCWVEGSVEFGGSLSLNLGVASGEIFLMAGIYFRLEHAGVTLSGYVRAGGVVTILGFIEVSILFYLALTYKSREAAAGSPRKTEFYGECTVSVRVSLGFFKKTVRVTMHKTFAGSDSSSGSEETAFLDTPAQKHFLAAPARKRHVSSSMLILAPKKSPGMAAASSDIGATGSGAVAATNGGNIGSIPATNGPPGKEAARKKQNPSPFEREFDLEGDWSSYLGKFANFDS